MAGPGTGKVFNWAVLFPGKIAPRILVFIVNSFPFALRRGNLAAWIPEVFPALIFLPQKHLTFDESAVSIEAADGLHVRIGQRVGNGCPQVGQVIGPVDGKRQGICPRWMAHLMQTTAGCTFRR